MCCSEHRNTPEPIATPHNAINVSFWHTSMVCWNAACDAGQVPVLLTSQAWCSRAWCTACRMCRQSLAYVTVYHFLLAQLAVGQTLSVLHSMYNLCHVLHLTLHASANLYAGRPFFMYVYVQHALHPVNKFVSVQYFEHHQCGIGSASVMRSIPEFKCLGFLPVVDACNP